MDADEAALAGIPNLRVLDFAPGQAPVSGNASVAIIMVPPIPNYRLAMARGTFGLQVHIIVLVSAVLDRRGQRKLAAFANQTGTSSIRAALEADQTLGGVVQDSHLLTFDPLGIEEVAEIGYFGGRFIHQVYASGV